MLFDSLWAGPNPIYFTRLPTSCFYLHASVAALLPCGSLPFVAVHASLLPRQALFMSPAGSAPSALSDATLLQALACWPVDSEADAQADAGAKPAQADAQADAQAGAPGDEYGEHSSTTSSTPQVPEFPFAAVPRSQGGERSRSPRPFAAVASTTEIGEAKELVVSMIGALHRRADAMDRDGMGVELLGPGARPRTQAHTDAEELYRRIQRVMPELEATRAHLENLDSNMRTAAAILELGSVLRLRGAMVSDSD